MRTTRQHRLDRACLRVLANCGDYLLPDANLRDEIGMLVVPSPTTAELDDTIRHHDSSRRLIGVQGETGTKWKLNDAGRAWLAEHT